VLEIVHDFLAESVTLRLFAVIGLGYVVGSWRIKSFSLGVAAVLFVGLGLGAWDPGAFEIPPVVAGIGLALFVYTIGLASGPGVFRALRTAHGLRLNALTFAAVTAAALVTLGLARLTQLPGPQAAGLFCGAVTNTPALAAQMEMQHRLARTTKKAVDLDGPVVGYSVAYPFGVLGVFLIMTLLFRTVRPEAELEAYERSTGSGHGKVSSRNYRVTRLKPNGNKLEAGWIKEQCGLVVARRLHGQELDVVEPDSILDVGDIVLAVGDEEMHARAAELLGEPAQEHLETQHGQVTYRRFFVSNPDLVGTCLRDLHLEAYHATATRLRRGDVEFPASGSLTLEEGDVLRVVGRPEDLERVGKLLGDSLEQIAHTDFLSVSLGMVLGVLLGYLPIPLGAPPYPTLGVAGGCLLVALVLGKLRRTGNIIWTLSLEANLALRQIGLLFFLACVGIQAGGQFVGAMEKDGLKMMACGALITLTSAGVMALGGRLLLKENVVPLLGVLAGAQTQPACLAYANSLVKSDGVSIGYSSVFSIAMIAKIVVATSLLTMLR
jgi:putative transport protein